jgi:hypothetical protein
MPARVVPPSGTHHHTAYERAFSADEDTVGG